MSKEIIPLLAESPKSEKALVNWNERLSNAFLAVKAKTVNDVLAYENLPENTITSLARQYGDDKLRSVLVLCMSDMLKFFNLTQGTMHGAQVVQTILLIQEDYGYLTIADFKVFFNRIKKGYYGQVYNRIDGQMILSWLSQYSEERANEAAMQNEIKAHSMKIRDCDTPARLKKIIDSAMPKSKR